jgi:hypothetical protein
MGEDGVSACLAQGHNRRSSSDQAVIRAVGFALTSHPSQHTYDLAGAFAPSIAIDDGAFEVTELVYAVTSASCSRRMDLVLLSRRARGRFLSFSIHHRACIYTGVEF